MIEISEVMNDEIRLSDEQHRALTWAAEWYDDPYGPQVANLLGPAGTGKTTLARQIANELGAITQYTAFSGKACHVLRRKGCDNATTLHSLLYFPVDRTVLAAQIIKTEHALAVETNPARRRELGILLYDLRKVAAEGPKWTTRPEFAGDRPHPLADVELVIVDEASMVGPKIVDDLLEREIKVLAIGDPYQLEPISGIGKLFAAGYPRFELTQIHRQAAGSPVIELATRVRTSSRADLGLESRDLHGLTDLPGLVRRFGDEVQVIAFTNKTRWSLIERIRTGLGRRTGMPEAGDKIICLANNRKLMIFNGQQFTVVDAELAEERDRGEPVIDLLLLDDEGRQWATKSYLGPFTGLAGEQEFVGNGEVKAMQEYGRNGSVGLFTFADAITCHKAQGSEWGIVVVWNEWGRVINVKRRKGATPAQAFTAGRQWLYTAVTRASDKVALRR